MISVIVPVYGVEKYLDRCVESVLNQTYKDFELLLVDDGSLDNCPRMCDEWAKKDERIRVFHKFNGGLSSARNLGLEKAKGDYIAFVDSDDFVHPDYLDYLYKALKERECDLVICDYLHFFTQNEVVDFKEDLKIIKEYDNYTFFLDDEYLLGTCDAKKIVAWNKLYKKELFNDVRFPEGKIHEDTAIYYKILYKAKKTVYIGNKLYCYFHNPNGITLSRFTASRFSDISFFCEEAEFFKKISKKDKRYKPFVYSCCKKAFETYDYFIETYDYFDFEHDKTSKEIKKKLKKILKKYKVYPLNYKYLYLYEFYFGKHSIILKTRYFFYKLKNWFKLKITKKRNGK